MLHKMPKPTVLSLQDLGLKLGTDRLFHYWSLGNICTSMTFQLWGSLRLFLWLVGASNSTTWQPFPPYNDSTAGSNVLLSTHKSLPIAHYYCPILWGPGCSCWFHSVSLICCTGDGICPGWCIIGLVGLTIRFEGIIWAELVTSLALTAPTEPEWSMQVLKWKSVTDIALNNIQRIISWHKLLLSAEEQAVFYLFVFFCTEQTNYFGSVWDPYFQCFYWACTASIK